MLKNVRNFWSSRKCHACLYPKERDGISAIRLCTPGICRGVKGHASLALIRYASALKSLLAGVERLDAILSIHPTDGLLSLSMRTCLWRRSLTTCSITSHNSTRPAISRSELVMVPPGLSSVWSWAFMLSGHSTLNTVGTHAVVIPNTTPPAPSFDALTMPTTLSLPGISYLT